MTLSEAFWLWAMVAAGVGVAVIVAVLVLSGRGLDRMREYEEAYRVRPRDPDWHVASRFGLTTDEWVRLSDAKRREYRDRFYNGSTWW